jgi:hypothetical protein
MKPTATTTINIMMIAEKLSPSALDPAGPAGFSSGLGLAHSAYAVVDIDWSVF